jgi:hypothetical protein
LSELKRGRKIARAPIADRLASLTGADIRLWFQDGSPEDRQRTNNFKGLSNIVTQALMVLVTY